MAEIDLGDRRFAGKPMSKRARKRLKRMRQKVSRGAMKEHKPVAMRMAEETIGSDARNLGRKFSRLMSRYERFRESQNEIIASTGRYHYFSFELWLIEKCQWGEKHFRPEGLTDAEADRIGFAVFMRVWRWWVRLHPINQLEMARFRHYFRP